MSNASIGSPSGDMLLVHACVPRPRETAALGCPYDESLRDLALSSFAGSVEGIIRWYDVIDTHLARGPGASY